MPIDEERRKVRLRDNRDDSVILDFDALKDQSRHVIPLLRGCRCPRRRQIAEQRRRVCQRSRPLGGRARPPQAILQPVPFGQIRLTGQIPPPVEFGDALEPADDFTPLPIGIMALLAPCLVERHHLGNNVIW
jgi:hypothetical protein